LKIMYNFENWVKKKTQTSETGRRRRRRRRRRRLVVPRPGTTLSHLVIEPCGIPKPKPKQRFVSIPNLDRSSAWGFFGIGIPIAVRDGHSCSIWYYIFSLAPNAPEI
jgi:hypothetical protein